MAKRLAPATITLLSEGISSGEISAAMSDDVRISQRAVRFQVSGRTKLSDGVFLAIMKLGGVELATQVRETAMASYDAKRAS